MLGLRPPVPAERSIEARERARALVAALAAVRPDLLEIMGIDLRPATEQALFHHFRQIRGLRPRGGAGRMRPLARLAFASFAGLAQWRLPELDGRVVAIVLNPAHLAILRPIEVALAEAGGPALVHISDGLASARQQGIPRLSRFLDPSWIGTLAGRYRMVRAAGAEIADLWASIVDRETAEVATQLTEADLHRQVTAVGCLSSIVQRNPQLILTFDELGRRARLIGPVAARAGVPSLDLPHAEAADPFAIAGASYDMFGVFGPRAHQVLLQAGISEARIREIGPARFDALIARPATEPASPRRVVFASQWLGGQMTPDVKRRTILMALRATRLVAPAEFVVVPHPLERDSIADDLLAHERIEGVTADVERSRSLHEVLDGAWVMITGWSNSVFEGLIARVPALCVTATGAEPPTTFVEDRLALGASSADETAAALAGLLDPTARERLLDEARRALEAHVGPLDGRAAERSAALIIELVRSRVARRAG